VVASNWSMWWPPLINPDVAYVSSHSITQSCATSLPIHLQHNCLVICHISGLLSCHIDICVTCHFSSLLLPRGTFASLVSCHINICVTCHFSSLLLPHGTSASVVSCHINICVTCHFHLTQLPNHVPYHCAFIRNIIV
jgi:hypothetical protein